MNGVTTTVVGCEKYRQIRQEIRDIMFLEALRALGVPSLLLGERSVCARRTDEGEVRGEAVTCRTC